MPLANEVIGADLDAGCTGIDIVEHILAGSNSTRTDNADVHRQVLAKSIYYPDAFRFQCGACHTADVEQVRAVFGRTVVEIRR